jgi:hypothetical protein
MRHEYSSWKVDLGEIMSKELESGLVHPHSS